VNRRRCFQPYGGWGSARDGLNLIRLRWLEGKIDAGLGRLDRAIVALSWMRAAFADEDNRYEEQGWSWRSSKRRGG